MSKYCAGIVTYNPDIKLFVQVFDAVYSQVEKIYIFDNGSNNIEDILCFVNTRNNVNLIRNQCNKGIAFALNVLCRNAMDDGFDWILTLDHDSICNQNMIKSFEELLNVENVGIICPRIKYKGFNKKEKGNLNDRYTTVQACMTSGSFMNLKAWDCTAGFDEWMFIDYVDNDICMQFKLSGYKMIRDNHVFMNHQLGNVKVQRRLFLKLNDFQYSPMRIYHIIRNEIYYYMKYFKDIRKIKDLVIIIRSVIIFEVLYYNDKERQNAIRKGIRDGINSQSIQHLNCNENTKL